MLNEPDAATADVAHPALPDAIATGRVIAIGRRLAPDDVAGVAAALVRGGIHAFEITLDSSAALEAIETLVSRFSPEQLLVGAGTVMDEKAARDAVAAGARFLVMPHLDPTLVRWAAARDLPALPGALTPTEILAAWRAGAAAVKLFPASSLGPAFVRELRGPLGHIPLAPTGGITAETAGEFVAAGAVAVGVGSWLTGSGDPAIVEARAAQLTAVLSRAALR